MLKNKGQIYLQFSVPLGALAQTFTLFAGGITSFSSTYPFVNITESSVDYDFLNQMLHENPIWIRSIQFNGSQFTTLSRAMQWRRYDANGKELINWDQPINQISAYQAQNGTATIKYKNLLLDTRSTLTINSLDQNQSVTLMIDYEQYKRTDAFTSDAESVVLQKQILSEQVYSENGKFPIWDREALRIEPAKDMFNANDINPDFNFD